MNLPSSEWVEKDNTHAPARALIAGHGRTHRGKELKQETAVPEQPWLDKERGLKQTATARRSEAFSPGGTDNDRRGRIFKTR